LASTLETDVEKGSAVSELSGVTGSASGTPFRDALDILVQTITDESALSLLVSKNVAAVVLYRISMALWKKDKRLDDALACMIKSLEQTMESAPIEEGLLRVDKGDILESVGKIHLDLGNFEEAKLAIIAALQEQHTTMMQRDGNEDEKYVARWKCARLSLKAGILHSTIDQLETAEQLLRNALSIVKRTHLSPHPEATVVGNSRANRLFFDLMMADILHQLGLVLARKRDVTNALDALNEAKHILEEAGKKPSYPKIRKIINDTEEVKKLEAERSNYEQRQAGANAEGSIEHGSVDDFDGLDMYEEGNSSLSRESTDSSDDQDAGGGYRYDRVADDLGCGGLPQLLEKLVGLLDADIIE
jgi:tetratricopeptide (TPR) repeat protein